MSTFDLVTNFFCAAIFPILIVINYRERSAPKTKFAAYMWANHPLLTQLGLVFIGLLAAISAVQLAGYYGYLSGNNVELARGIMGLPMLVMAVAVIGFSARALYLARSKP